MSQVIPGGTAAPRSERALLAERGSSAMRVIARSRHRHGRLGAQRHPGLEFTRADAVRSLLTRALDQIEGPSAPANRGGR
jgi:hypothetical protein